MSLPHHSLMPETGDHAPSFERAGLPPYATPVAHGGPPSASGRGRGPGPYVPAAWRVRREPVMEVPEVLAVAELESAAGRGVVDADVVDAAVEEATGEVADETVVEAAGDAPDDSLPWIDAFLATTPAASMDAIPDLAEAVRETAEAESIVDFDADLDANFDTSFAADFAGDFTRDFASDVTADIEADVEADSAVDVGVEAEAATFAAFAEVGIESEGLQELTDAGEPSDVVGRSEEPGASDAVGPSPAVEAMNAPSAPVDEWPLEEAASELDLLAHRLEAFAPPPSTEPAALFAEPHTPEPLPVWSDDDMVDIMPVRQPLFTPRSQPAALGAQAADRDGSAEAAAHALELLARRVRTGELPLPGYEPRMGDAAALVAALAALLGVKLG
ncbi:hypothetical protein [Gemmatimonas aurantiaca]|uniref:hypothetical protein n=1 Tax=Gemmatimonas aurantiaca TaxID=173480 RepID=UPI00301DCB5C